MEDKLKNNQKEIIGAILTIALVLIFILLNYFAGFNLPVYLAAMIPAAYIAFSYPKAGLFAMVFLTFIFERFFTLVPVVVSRTEYKIYPIDLLIIAALLGTLAYALKGKIRIKLGRADVLILIFIILAIVYGISSAALFGGDAALSASSAKNYSFYAILFFLASFLIREKEDFRNLAGFAFAGGVGIIIFIIFGVANGEGLWSQYTPLSTDGVRTLAFTHAFYLCMASIAAFAYVLLEKKDSWLNKVFAVSIPLWAVGIVGSMMRHLWISLAVAVIFVLLASASKMTENSLKLVVRYIVTGIVLAVSVFYISSVIPNSSLSAKLSHVTGTVSQRFTSISNSADESIFWRGVAWKEAVKRYSESPLLGIGFGKKISVEIGSYRDFVEVRNIHNSFLVLLVQMGLAGIMLLSLAVFLLAKGMRDLFAAKEAGMVEIAVTGILFLHVVAFFFQPYLETNLLGIFFWINLGLIRSISERKNRQ